MVGIQRVQHVSVPMRSDGHEAARQFYGTYLGLQEIAPPADLTQLSLIWFKAGNDGQEIHCFADDAADSAKRAQHLCFQVADLDAVRTNLRAAGVVLEETTPIHNRPRCFVRDPFGNLIELTEIIGAYRPAAPAVANASAD